MRADNYQKELRIVTVTGPASEPVTAAELKAQLRVDISDDDALITAKGKAARQLIEALTGRRMITRTEKLLLDDFPPCDGIVIPVAPVTAVSKVSYFDEDGTETVVDSSDYVVDVNGPVGRVVLKSDASWPDLTTSKRPINAVEVHFEAGYANAAAVPEPLKDAVKMLTGDLYGNREASTPLTLHDLPNGLKTLIWPYIVWEAKL